MPSVQFSSINSKYTSPYFECPACFDFYDHEAFRKLLYIKHIIYVKFCNYWVQQMLSYREFRGRYIKQDESVQYVISEKPGCMCRECSPRNPTCIQTYESPEFTDCGRDGGTRSKYPSICSSTGGGGGGSDGPSAGQYAGSS